MSYSPFLILASALDTSLNIYSRSKEIMTAAGVPCVPGYHGQNQDVDFLEAEADKIKYPVLIKAIKGGGGKGMRIAASKAEFQTSYSQQNQKP